MGMNTAPEYLKPVLSDLQRQYGRKFFLEGGCGVAAAIMAEVALSQGAHCNLNLIMREDEVGDEILSHIALSLFVDRASNDPIEIDIDGDDAYDRWVESWEALELEDEGEIISSFDERWVDLTGDDVNIKEELKRVTEDYGLNVGVEWIDEHYDRLKARALKVAAAPKGKPAMSIGLESV